MGQGLAIALGRAGAGVTLLARTPRPVVEPLVLFTGDWAEATLSSDLVIVAVPDDAIAEAAATLAPREAITSSLVVLHLSGLLDRSALGVLAPTGAALGSFHPLQTIADPTTAPARLLGAYAGVEGDPRAEAEGEQLAEMLGMHPIRLTAAAKPAYHAGAVFAANFLVALAGVAERLAREAGIPDVDAGRVYLPLLRGAASNLDAGAAAALTGPIVRGDVATIRAHLGALGAEDRELYRRLGLATLPLARQAGLSGEAAARVAELLGHRSADH
jgi:predicted short-subunit dehydrogenase-like oxidoreductase (DUF2520 family)